MFKEIVFSQNEEWDRIVRSFDNYDVYYLNGYVSAFKENGDGEPLLIYFEEKDCRAMTVVLKRDISNIGDFTGILDEGEFFDFITPYGYGGPLIEGNNPDTFEKQYASYCTANKIVSEFVRFSPVLDNVNKNMFDCIKLGKTVTIDTSSPEIIWDNIKSKNRNMIRKAIKNDIHVFWTRSPEILYEFIGIYNSTMDKDSADSYYYFDKEFYNSILYDLKDNALWFYAKLDDRIIATSIFLFANHHMHYHLSGSDQAYRSFAPSNLIIYEAALFANSIGCTQFHLGGGVGCHEDNLYKFKETFNKNSDSDFWIGKKIYNKGVYDKLVSLRVEEIEDTNFFPLYRAK